MKFDTFGDLNYLAIAVATVAYWVLGALWYSPALFGKRWMGATGITPESAGSPGLMYAATFVMYFVSVTALAFVGRESGAANLNDGLQLGLGVGTAFSAVAIVVTLMYEQRPRPLLWINAAYHVVGLALAGVIVTLWD